MKQIRKFSTNPISLFIVLSIFLIFSCSDRSPNSRLKEFSGKDFMMGIYFLDGEVVQYIDALNTINLETIVSEEIIEDVRLNIDHLLNELELAYPGTFAGFETDMTSGNHVVISESIRYHAHLMFDFISNRNEEHALNMAFENGPKPVIEIIDSYLPVSLNEANPEQVRDLLLSESFNSELEDYYTSLETKIGGRTDNSEEQMCSIIAGAAVLIVAAIAVLVVYAVAVLAAVEVASVWDTVWGPKELARQDANNSLIREQIINSIAINFNSEI